MHCYDRSLCQGDRAEHAVHHSTRWYDSYIIHEGTHEVIARGRNFGRRQVTFKGLLENLTAGGYKNEKGMAGLGSFSILT